MITVVDYRAGNLASVQKALRHLGYESQVTDNPEVVRRSPRIILPGVGHFSSTQRIADLGVNDAIREVVARGVPFLGICVGMQWLYEGSTEAPDVTGLGTFAGMVERFPDDPAHKVPHVGWNQLTRVPGTESRLLRDIPDGSFVYYTHSYRGPVVPGVVATTNYAGDFAAVVERDNVFGVQFHPEKSGETGLKMLRNFCEVNA